MDDGASTSGQVPQFTEDKPPTERRPAAQSKRSVKVVEGLAKQFGMLGMFVYLGNQYDGSVILGNALPMAESLEQIGRKNKTFYRVLVLLAEESEWTALFMAFGGTTVAIGANHGLFPRNWTRAFQLDPPPPPARENTEASTQNTGTSGASMGPTESIQDQFGNEWHATPDGGANLQPEVAGLHINADQMRLIAEQAAREQLRLRAIAEQQGAVP